MKQSDASSIKNSACGITAREKIGYACGDMGMQFAFGLISSVLQKYYTDVLKINIALIMVLFIAARVWDAVNDPMWGAFIDTRPLHARGRYRRWILYMSVPMAVSCVLMFVKVPNASVGTSFALACVTYTMFGMIYTTVNVPYGSMASVMTSDDRERTSLSTFRAVGSAIGAVPAILLIMLCYTKQDDGSKAMDYTKIIVGVIVIAALAAVLCLLCYYWTRERIIVAPRQKREKGYVWHTVTSLLKCRAFLVLSVAAMLFLAATVFSQSYYTYLAVGYFNMPAFATIAIISQYLPMGILMIGIGKWVKKYGRRELCAFGMLAAGIFNLILFFVQTTNPWVFIIIGILAGFGNAFLFLQIWALATEVIDYVVVKKNVTDRATSFSLFSFIRKLGHAVAAVFINASLLKIGYSADNLTAAALQGMYNDSVLIPAVLYLSVFVLLAFFYPLGKKQVQALQREMAANNTDVSSK